jgi:hypothetical protein
MKTWAGGGSGLLFSPRPRLARSLATGLGDTRYSSHKNTKHDIVCNFKNLTQKIGQSASEILGR